MVDHSVRPLIDLVAPVADHALELWAGGRTKVERWEKTPGEIVCEADLAVNAMLHEALAKLDPEAGWLSEETIDSADRLGRSRTWVVDPIDGTRDYLEGKPGWALSVALVEEGVPMIGLLVAPARNEIWVAQAGKGAWRNGRQLVASKRVSFAGARVPTDKLPDVDADLSTVYKPNSIALRMAMVAADEADLVATVRWGNEWDIAASALIAQEAGAYVTDALGRPLVFNRPRPSAAGVLCCAPAIHADAVIRLNERALAILGQQP